MNAFSSQPLFAVPQSSFDALHCLWSLPVIRSHSSRTAEAQHIVLPLYGGGEEGVVPIAPPGKRGSCQRD